MKIGNLLFACTLVAAAGLGMGYASQSHADPGCLADCYDARYECNAQCSFSPNPTQCKAYCQVEFEACKANCGL